jgi:hypothetical protein
MAFELSEEQELIRAAARYEGTSEVQRRVISGIILK